MDADAPVLDFSYVHFPLSVFEKGDEVVAICAHVFDPDANGVPQWPAAETIQQYIELIEKRGLPVLDPNNWHVVGAKISFD